ncbi:MAG: glycosyltransferase family 4 protein [Bacilli bacterium]|nr:glycosyltransferase family 4 protein [Bacilli bacterium]
MKILVVCQYYYPENVAISPMCESLVRRGHDVQVITGKPNYDFGRILEGYEKITDEVINGVKVHRLNLVPRTTSKLSLIRNYLSFWRNAKRYLSHLEDEYDLVYSMEMSPLMAVEGGGVYAKKHNVPFFIHCLDLWPESVVFTGHVKKGSLIYKYLYKWSRRIYLSADEILISSPSFGDYFEKVLKITDMKIKMVPQPPLFNPIDDPSFRFKKKYNIVYAGNLGTLQLMENYAQSLAKFKDRDDFTFHIFGKGVRLDSVYDIIKEKGLENIVEYHGVVPNEKLGKYLNAATALVVPLKNGDSPVSLTIPNKLISSLSYSKPIIATIGGDGRKILEEANGSLFSGEEPEDIARMIEEVISLPEEKLKEMGENNHAYFLKHFEFEAVMDQLEKEFIVSKKN